MILKPIDLFFNLDALTEEDSISTSKESDADKLLRFKEGDTYKIRVHLRKEYDDATSSYQQLESNYELILVSAAIDNAVDSLNYLCYTDQFEEIQDEDGDICYEGILSFATQEAIDFLSSNDSRQARIELIIRDKALGHQQSLQGDMFLDASLLKSTVEPLGKPSINIGSYSTVQELASAIVDERILDLKDGAPLEFDTLYELAHYAQKVRSHEIVVGDFQSYLDGKKLADQNLTVTQINQLAVDTSTYEVSHEPWRPRSVDAIVVE